MVNMLKFNEIEVKRYIDEAIRFWRKKRDHEAIKSGIDDIEELYREGGLEGLCTELIIAICYIDACQSMRVSLFGKKLE